MLWVPNRQKDPAKLLSVKAVLTLNSSASSVNLKVIGSESSVSCTRSYILNQGPGLGQDYLNVREPHLRILMNFDMSWSYINESVINSVQIECEVGFAICWRFICTSNFSSKPLLLCCFDRACTMQTTFQWQWWPQLQCTCMPLSGAHCAAEEGCSRSVWPIHLSPPCDALLAGTHPNNPQYVATPYITIQQVKMFCLHIAC